MTPKLPQCYECKHGYGTYFTVPKCDAFPEGIPKEIIYDADDHSNPLPGQKNSIVFEPIAKPFTHPEP